MRKVLLPLLASLAVASPAMANEARVEARGGVFEVFMVARRLAAEHGIVADVEVIDIADINEAWQRVKDSDVRYRFVIDIAGSLRG